MGPRSACSSRAANVRGRVWTKKDILSWRDLERLHRSESRKTKVSRQLEINVAGQSKTRLSPLRSLDGSSERRAVACFGSNDDARI